VSAGLASRPSTVDLVAAQRVRRSRRRRTVIAVLAAAVVVVFCLTLMVGRTFYPPGDVLRVVLGEQVPGASFTVGRLRLPRAVLAVVAGLSFGLAGVTFQTMLRNPLASPDVIGISTGASAAAVVAIVLLGLGGTSVSAVAVVAALAVALMIYLLAFKHGGAGTRFILIGIGVAAMLESVINYVLSQAGQWDYQEALRWLSGSLNGVSWERTLPALVMLLVLGPVLLGQSRNLAAVQLGDDTAAALGVRVERTRLVAIVGAVGLVAFATAACGPIASRSASSPACSAPRT
jgi:iron complex transport system permease protein